MMMMMRMMYGSEFEKIRVIQVVGVYECVRLYVDKQHAYLRTMHLVLVSCPG